MNFKQTVTKEDYLAFYKYHVTKNFLSPTKIFFVVLFIGTLLSGPFFGQPEMAYFGGAFLIIVILLYFRVTRSGGKIYDADTDAFNYTYKLDDVTISFSTKDGKSSKMWTEFVRYHETEEYLYIFTKSNKGLMFNRRDISVEIYDFMKKKLDENIKTLPIPKFNRKK